MATKFTKLVKLLKQIILLFIIVSVGLVLLFRFIDPPASMLMVQQKLTNWNIKQQHQWRNYADIAANIKIAVIAAEDQNFATHLGFDVGAIKQAIIYNESNQSVRGASTITQQVAKNLFLWPARSFIRKAFEFWFTLWIELFWSKERILEIYLNSVEWGTGIFGVEAASRYYFNTSAKQLTLEQASLLAAALPNPRYLNPAHPNIKLSHKADWIKTQIRNLDKNTYLKTISAE